MNAYFPIRELLCLPHGCRSEVMVITLKAYFDDSGTHADSEITAIGGLIGTPAQWAEVERRWAALLANPLPGKPPLKKFHLSECNAKDGQFRDYKDAECDLLTHDFRQILIDAKVISTASVVDKKAWDELIVGPDRDWCGDGVNACIDNCLQETLKIAGAHPSGQNVAVFFDRGIWTERIKQQTEEYTAGLGTPRIVQVSFVKVEDVLPLQGADICATENYWNGIQVLRNGIGAQPRAHMRHYLKNMHAEGFMIDRAQIVNFVLPGILELRRSSGQPPS